MRKLLFVLLLFVWFASAVNIPDPTWYVNDFAHILSVDQVQTLESQLDNFHQQTSTEISIVTIPDLQGEDISMLATEIGQKRWVGDVKYDRGLLIVVAPHDRAWFIAVGYGLEWTIPDAIAKRIWENNFPSYFRDEDYFGGLSAALQDIESYIQADPTVVEQYTSSDQIGWQENIGIWLFFALVVSIFLFSMIKNKRLYWVLGWIWLVIIISIVSSIIVIGLFFWTFVWVMIVASIFGKRWGWSIWWFGSSGWWWSSGGSSWWFGGFGGGSFWGGGAGGKR